MERIKWRYFWLGVFLYALLNLWGYRLHREALRQQQVWHDAAL